MAQRLHALRRAGAPRGQDARLLQPPAGHRPRGGRSSLASASRRTPSSTPSSARGTPCRARSSTASPAPAICSTSCSASSPAGCSAPKRRSTSATPPRSRQRRACRATCCSGRRRLGPTIADRIGAARFLIDLLRSRPDLRLRFPRALTRRSARRLRRVARRRRPAPLRAHRRRARSLRGALEDDVSRPVRQYLLFRDDIRTRYPLGFLPAGRRGLLEWAMGDAVRSAAGGSGNARDTPSASKPCGGSSSPAPRTPRASSSAPTCSRRTGSAPIPTG